MIETDTRYRDIENVLNIKPAKKSMKYKILVGIVAISLLAGVSAALYFFVFKDSAGNQSSSSKPLEKETKNKETEDEKTQTEEGKIDTIAVNNALIMEKTKLGENLQGEGENSVNSSTENENAEGIIVIGSQKKEGTTEDDDSINEKDQQQINGFDQGNQEVVMEIVVELNNMAQGEQQEVDVIIIPVDQDSDEEVPKEEESNNENQNQEQQQIEQDDERQQGQTEDDIKERETEYQDIIDKFSAFWDQLITSIMDMMN